jgi:hypothetical protein
MVPRIAAAVALTAAMRKLSFTARMIASSWASTPYHLKEKPPQTVTSLETLKL